MSFDLTGVESSTMDYQPLPTGIYKLVIDEAELKDTKAGTGQYINVRYEVVSGDWKGRKLWNMFNVKNPNPQAVEIGMQQLRSMIELSNKPKMLQFSDVSKLCGLQVWAQVKIDGENRNKIHYFVEKDLAEEQLAPKSNDFDADSIPF